MRCDICNKELAKNKLQVSVIEKYLYNYTITITNGVDYHSESFSTVGVIFKDRAIRRKIKSMKKTFKLMYLS